MYRKGSAISPYKSWNIKDNVPKSQQCPYSKLKETNHQMSICQNYSYQNLNGQKNWITAVMLSIKRTHKMAKTAMKNTVVHSKINKKAQTKIMKQFKDSTPYFQNYQCQQSLIVEDYTWTSNGTKSLLADMFQVQKLMEWVHTALDR